MEKVSVPEANLLLDDHILALSKVCKANLIVDVTRLDPKQRIGAFPASAKAQATTGAMLRVRGNLLSDFEEVARTTKLPFDRSTFLLWDQVDAKELAQLIVKLGKDRPIEKRPGDRELRAALSPFVPPLPTGELTEAQQRALEKRGTYKLGQLPPQIQSLLVALSRQEALRPQRHVSRFLDDDFWKSARILREDTGYVPGPRIGSTLSADDEKEAPHLALRFDDCYTIRRWGLERNTTGVRPPDPPESQDGEAMLPAPAYETTKNAASLWRELNGEDALGAKVSLEAKRQPLRTLLASVTKQSGVTLKVAPTVSADALVTLGVKEMPLSTFMTALGRTFNLSWTKSSPKSWTCSDDESDELHKLLARSHERMAFTSFQNDVSSVERQGALADDVDALFDAPEVDATAGIAFSSLPAPLQKRVRDEFEFRACAAIVDDYKQAFLYLTPDSVVSLLWAGFGNSLSVSVKPATLLGGMSALLEPTTKEQDAFFKQRDARFAPKPDAQPQLQQQPVEANDNQ